MGENPENIYDNNYENYRIYNVTIQNDPQEKRN